MPTGGKTQPIHIYEGIASFLKELKAAEHSKVWKILESNLSNDFIKKYNNWVANNPKGKGYKTLNEKDEW